MIRDECIRDGVFRAPICTECDEYVWPPADICSACFGRVALGDVMERARILEYSRKGDVCFCIIEMDNGIRVMARSRDIPRHGQEARLSGCGIGDEGYFFEITLV